MAPARRYHWIIVGTVITTLANIAWWQHSGSAFVNSMIGPSAGSDVTTKERPAAVIPHGVMMPEVHVDFWPLSKDSQPDPYLPLFGGVVLQGRRTIRVKTTSYANLRENYIFPSITNPSHVDCRAILDGDTDEHQRAQEFMKSNVKVPIFEEQYVPMLQDCQQFKRDRGYVTVPLTLEEENYPLAFGIAVEYNIEQVERLLRAIYQPQNLYCLHLEPRYPLRLHAAILALASCFHNVFVATALSDTLRDDVSLLLPAINCMQDLVHYHQGQWKYFINLEEREFPLRTNWELVQIAKIFNGSNDIGGSKYRVDTKQVSFEWKTRYSQTLKQTVHYNTNKLRANQPPISGGSFFWGDIHGMFSRRMVEYIIHNGVARDFLSWCAGAGSPANYFWATLNNNPQLAAPGGYSGPDDVAHHYSFSQISRVKHWTNLNYDHRLCRGQELEHVCVFGLGDVPWLVTRPELAAHGLNLTSQYLALDCLEEWHRNRTRDGDAAYFDASLYTSLPTRMFSRNDGL